MSDDSPTERDTTVSRDDSHRSPREGEIPRDELYRLLASERRRAVVSFLASRTDDMVPLDDVVAVVVESECPDSGPGTHRERVTTELHHVHLPKLDDAGVVFYDDEDWTVEYHGSKRLESLLAATEGSDGVNE